MPLYPGRQNCSLLISAHAHVTHGSPTLNMTKGVTVAAESELQTHTQHAGSRGKVPCSYSGGSRFKSRPERRLRSLKPFVIFLSSSRDSAVGIATALRDERRMVRGLSSGKGTVFSFYSLHPGRFWSPSSLLSNV
jgi:hypothetical protein